LIAARFLHDAVVRRHGNYLTTFRGRRSGEQPNAEFRAGFQRSDIPTLTLADALGFSGLVSGFDQNGATTDQIALSSN
jgi:hypothetical protein